MLFNFFAKLTISDWIETIGIFVSLITSITAIYISVKTLKQNSQMIEESTRPYITLSGKTTNFYSPRFYLVLKNYGNSGATITNFSCSHDLSQFSLNKDHIPYLKICGTFIAPNQSFITNLSVDKLFINNDQLHTKNGILHFEIEYKSEHKTYKDEYDIVLEAYSDLVQSRSSPKNQEMKVISYTLQDLVEKNL